MNTGADLETVGTPHSDIKPLKYLTDLSHKPLLGGIPDGEKETRLLVDGIMRGFFHIKVEAVVPPRLLIEPKDTGDPFGGRNADIVFVVDPKEIQYPVEFLEVECRVTTFHFVKYGFSGIPGNFDLTRVDDFGMAFAFKFEFLQLQFTVASG